MNDLPIIAAYNKNELNGVLKRFTAIKLLSTEKRKKFSAEFPAHTRYFSNGDIPLVALINVSGTATFGYENKQMHISNGDFIFFDDSKSHSWIFKNSDLEIFYYRLPGTGANAVQGDYCLDNFF